MATYYVGTGGNNASAGTSWGARWLTLTKAASVVTAGDTVYCQGTFRETLTLTTSGTAGNVITWIGDYAGTNTSGSKGIARITGSDDDITATRTSCITNSGSIAYNTIQGFAIDLASGKGLYLIAPDHITVTRCHISLEGAGGACIRLEGTGQTTCSITNCVLMPSRSSQAVLLTAASTTNAAHVMKSCIVVGGVSTDAVQSIRVGDVTVSNMLSIACGQVGGIYASTSPAASHPLVLNNSLIIGAAYGVYAAGAGDITENYNTFSQITTPRTNVTTGANSVTTPALLDTRWLFEATNGGTLITPFDLASYSTLVEYNSGTGAPSTDLRGASQTGSYREWGPLEYNAGLSITGGSATAAFPVIGGGIIRGVG